MRASLSELTVGLDLGDKYSWMCVLDQDASTMEEARIATTPEAVRRRFSEMAPARVALRLRRNGVRAVLQVSDASRGRWCTSSPACDSHWY